jgi:hypothetical protein
MVFRPGHYRFPPSRGRQEYVFNPGGKLIATGPGSTDQPQTETGTWAMEGNTLVLHLPSGDRHLHIVSFEPERLVITRQLEG